MGFFQGGFAFFDDFEQEQQYEVAVLFCFADGFVHLVYFVLELPCFFEFCFYVVPVEGCSV